MVSLCGGLGCASGELDKAPVEDWDSEHFGDLELDGQQADAPRLLEATIYRSGTTCFLNAVYSDPQGPADVRRGTVRAVDTATGEEHWVDDLFVCVDDECVGSFDDRHPEYSEAPCNRVDALELRGFVFDKSGIHSNELIIEQI